MIWVAWLMAKHEAMLAERHSVGHQATLSLQVAWRCGDASVPNEDVQVRLTPELSRTAARNGGVVHVTMQPSREAVSA